MELNKTLQQGITALKEGKFQEAERLYQKILQTQPTHPHANHNLGITLYTLGRLKEAETSFKKAIKFKPDYIDAYYNLGLTLQKLHKLEEAETSYKKAIALKPNYAIAHNNLGNTLKDLGKLNEAEASYKKAIALNPDFAQAYNNMGLTLQKLHKLEEAETNYKKAITLKPDYAVAHNNLGITLYSLGRLKEAEGITLYTPGRLKEAEVSYKKAIEFKPDFAQAYYNLGIVLEKFHKHEEAETNYKKAIEFKPDYVEAYYNLGLTLQKLHKLEEAETSYKKAIALKPNYAIAHNNLGNTLKGLGKLNEAEASYKKAIALKPDNRTALLNRGQILFEKGEFELSLKDFDACNNTDSRSRALISLYALGRVEEIYQRIETHSELDDENIRVAAFSSFIANKEKKDTAHNFCRKPMDFINFSNLSSHLKNPSSFITEVIEELHNVKTIWEPLGTTTYKGLQSISNLFENPLGKLRNLKSIIKDELDLYYLKFKNEFCSYIKKWPSKKNLFAWHVILKNQGYQDAHIHSGGWLSGVIYLKLVPALEKNEGAIEFGLNGAFYSDVKSPKVIYQPKLGDIILFPSSLHHKTIPFSTDTDRISIAFDLMPKGFKL